MSVRYLDRLLENHGMRELAKALHFVVESGPDAADEDRLVLRLAPSRS